MIGHNIAVLICRNTLALFCAAGIAASPATPQEFHNLEVKVNMSLRGAIATKQSLEGIASLTKRFARNDGYDIDLLARTNLWRYLRTGINYLEASGRDIPIHYRHPGGKAYGPLALTPIAIKDVRLNYPALSGHALKNVLSDRGLYEKFAAAYAELLLKHYLKVDYSRISKEEVFEALQKSWFLGPTLYKKGLPVIASRQKRAAEYIDSPTVII
jgi:hypothetical protein